MARIIDDIPKELDLGVRVRVVIEGVTYEGEVVRCGNTRSWGHMICDRTKKRIEFDVTDDGFKIID